MMRPVDGVVVYLCREPVDMRKSMDGLSTLVQAELELDPFAQQLYVFTNRKRDKIKVLYWERSGFVVWYKRLEKARFPWLDANSSGVVTVSGRELNWLLDGIDWFRIQPHEALRFESVM